MPKYGKEPEQRHTIDDAPAKPNHICVRCKKEWNCGCGADCGFKYEHTCKQCQITAPKNKYKR